MKERNNLMVRWMIFLQTKYEYRRMFLKINEITGTNMFFHSRVDMETPPPDKASTDPPVATNVRVEEDRVRLDGTSSKERLYKQNFPRKKK